MNIRSGWSPAATLLALFAGLDRAPTDVAAGIAVLVIIVLAAVLFAPDARSVPERALLLICLLQRVDPATWLESSRRAAPSNRTQDQ